MKLAIWIICVSVNSLISMYGNPERTEQQAVMFVSLAVSTTMLIEQGQDIALDEIESLNDSTSTDQ